jgi:hypothetical protein
VWDNVVPSKLPSPTADLDALNGIKGKGEAGRAAAGGGMGDMADGVSVLEGAAGTGTADGGSDEYDRDDSFLADSGPKGPAGAGRHRPRRGHGSRYGGGGGAGFSSFDLPQPQEPIQSGATEMGEHREVAALAAHCSSNVQQRWQQQQKPQPLSLLRPPNCSCPNPPNHPRIACFLLQATTGGATWPTTPWVASL